MVVGAADAADRARRSRTGPGCTRGVRHCVRPNRDTRLRTSRITLGTSVLDALFQSPIILARRLATLDRFSDGRLIAGIGQGWMEQEFEAAGVSMKRPVQGSRNTSWPCEPSGVPTLSASRVASTAFPRLTSAQTGKAGRPTTDGGRWLTGRG
jgi:hypothetical protein